MNRQGEIGIYLSGRRTKGRKENTIGVGMDPSKRTVKLFNQEDNSVHNEYLSAYEDLVIDKT